MFPAKAGLQQQNAEIIYDLHRRREDLQDAHQDLQTGNLQDKIYWKPRKTRNPLLIPGTANPGTISPLLEQLVRRPETDGGEGEGRRAQNRMDKSFGAVTFLPCILLSTAAAANADDDYDDTAGFIFFTRDDGAGHMRTSTRGGTFPRGKMKVEK